MIGRPVREACPEVLGQQVFQMFDRVYATGVPESVPEFRLQMELPGNGSVEVFLLYSDGILERPGRDLPSSTVELAQAAGDIAADRALHDEGLFTADRVATQTLELLTRITGRADDVTLLAAQLVAPVAQLSLTVPATAEWLPDIRVQADEWLGRIHAGTGDGDALRHALIELATNTMDHAYIDSADLNTVTITGSLTDTGQVELRVRDRGRWREPRPSEDRGLGLRITSKLIDTLQVRHDEGGTTASVSHRLTRPARVLLDHHRPSGTTRRPPAPDTLLTMLDQPVRGVPWLRVKGPVDTSTVADFDRDVRNAGSAGGRALTVDLTEVSHLAGTGVAALFQLVSLHRANGTALRLFAPAGTPADLIMTLVELAHDTCDDPGPDIADSATQ